VSVLFAQVCPAEMTELIEISLWWGYWRWSEEPCIRLAAYGSHLANMIEWSMHGGDVGSQWLVSAAC